jgi:hypothetical protein
VRIFSGCAGGMAWLFRYARSLRRLSRFQVLAAQQLNILIVVTLHTMNTVVVSRSETFPIHVPVKQKLVFRESMPCLTWYSTNNTCLQVFIISTAFQYVYIGL